MPVLSKKIHNSIDASIIKIQRYMNNLNIDPVHLTKVDRLNGKKHYAELIYSYICIHRFYGIKNDLPAQKKIHDRLKFLFDATDNSDFHNLGDLNNNDFTKQISSYLHIYSYMKSAGFDSELYHAHLREITPRFTNHIHERGSSIRLAFSFFCKQLELSEPEDIEILLEGTIIRSRRKAAIMMKAHAYLLFHEIFFVFGTTQEMQSWITEDDIQYIHDVLLELSPLLLKSAEIDLLAELSSAMFFMGLYDRPEYAQNIKYILRSQKRDGSFPAMYEYDDVAKEKIRVGLHTMTVCTAALVFARSAGQQHLLYI